MQQPKFRFTIFIEIDLYFKILPDYYCASIYSKCLGGLSWNIATYCQPWTFSDALVSLASVQHDSVTSHKSKQKFAFQPR